jgi:hypothetical protein
MKRSLPIRRRLALIIAVSLGVSLLLTSLFFAARQIDHRRSAKLTELRSMAEVIAFNATAVVEFQDMGAAERLFALLGQHPDIVAAQMTSADGASATLPAGRGQPPPPFRQPRLNNGTAQVAPTARHAIAMERWNDRLGGADRQPEERGTMSSSTLPCSPPPHWLPSCWPCSLPSTALAAHRPRLARHQHGQPCRQHQDFSERAQKYSGDEIGQLADAFNTMLVEIADRDRNWPSIATTSKTRSTSGPRNCASPRKRPRTPTVPRVPSWPT